MINATPVILCGGSGTRLWPLSRAGFPKQFLVLSGITSLFQQAIERVNQVGTSDIAVGSTLVVTNEEHRFLSLDQLRELPLVNATGVQYSVRQFITWSAAELGITLRFEGQGVNEVALVEKIEGKNAPLLNVGDVIVKVDPRYFRPTEVETLLGDPSKAMHKLGWTPEITAQEMCAEMVAHDMKVAKQQALLKQHGYDINVSSE